MKRFTLFVVILAALALSACTARFSLNLFTAEEIVAQSFSTGGRPRVVVEMFNGGIDVITGSGTAVDVKVTKRGGGNSQSEAEADLRNVEVQMVQDGDTIRVTARRTDSRVDIGNSGASARLTVPNGALLDLRTSNGAIASSGPVGDVTARTSNGAMSVISALGQIDLKTSNGQITVNGGSGLLKLESSNGGLDITADNVAVEGRTSNGVISFTGSLAEGSHNTLTTSNAGIIVILPASATFRVTADTGNGRINNDFAVNADRMSETELRGSVGSDPATVLELHASNGNIDLRQSR